MLQSGHVLHQLNGKFREGDCVENVLLTVRRGAVCSEKGMEGGMEFLVSEELGSVQYSVSAIIVLLGFNKSIMPYPAGLQKRSPVEKA